jgi:hypothetical protein
VDLYSISKTLWRHKFLTIPLVVLTLFGCAYVYIGGKPTYQSTATYVALPPPNAVTPQALAKDPALRSANPDNPLAQGGDPGVVVAIIIGDITSNQSKADLEGKGASPTYSAVQSTLGGPTIQLTSKARSLGLARKSMSLLEQKMTTDLQNLQGGLGVDPYFMYKLVMVNSTPPILQVSGSLRSMLSIFALGVIGIFIVVSIGDALDKRRQALRAGHPEPEVDEQLASAEPRRPLTAVASVRKEGSK